MVDIRQRIGLDYLRKRGTEEESAAEGQGRGRPPFLDDALLAYGRPMLEAIRRAAPGTARLHAIVDELQIPIDVALRLVEYLEENGRVVIVSRDLKGNHELRLTEQGLQLLR